MRIKKGALTASFCALSLCLSAAFIQAAGSRQSPDKDLHLQITDSFGKPVRNEITLEITRFCDAGEKSSKNTIPANTTDINIKSLFDESCWSYRIGAGAASYSRTLRTLGESEINSGYSQVKMLISPSKVSAAVFPVYEELPPRLRDILEKSPHVKAHDGLSGKNLYDNLGDNEKSVLLNIAAKAQATVFPDQSTVLDHLTTLLSIGKQNINSTVSDELPKEADMGVKSNVFNSVTSLLHRAPEGYKKIKSYKTSDRQGNLHITLSGNGTSYIADIDVDENHGFNHILEVLDDILPYQMTHPYKIGQILFAKQGIDIGYRLEARPK